MTGASWAEDLPIWKPTPRIPARFVLDRFAPTLAEVDWARASGWFDAATIEQLAAATDDSQADLPDARRWLWLALAWLYEHRGEYADPWSEVEALWEAFDHAHELSGLIRWMPRQPGRPAGMDAMTERWRRLVEASSPPNDIRE
jgi:hypothetical protein